MTEKRRFPRLDKAFEVRYAAKTKLAEIQGYSVSSNISEGGICLPLCKHVKTGDTVSLDINTYEKKRVAAKGKVKWIKDIKRLAPLQLIAGIEFTDIAPAQARILVTA